MATSKPDLRRVWAEGAPGANVVDPDVADPGKFDAGWVAEIPPFEYYNFLQQLYTQGLAHINEQGIAIYDADTDYPVGALAKGSDNTTYKAEIVNGSSSTPVNPVGDSTGTWVVTFINPNFYEDSGAADVYEVAASSGTQVPKDYIDGLPIYFRPSVSCTGGAVTVDVEGIGVVSVKTKSGANPALGSIVATQLTNFIFDLANGWFELIEPVVASATTTAEGVVELATQAEEITGTDPSRVITALTHANSLRVAKAWVNFTGTGTLTVLDSFNVSSVTDNAVGNYTVNLSITMPNLNYLPISTGRLTSNLIVITSISIAATSYGLTSYNAADVQTDAAGVHSVVFASS